MHIDTATAISQFLGTFPTFLAVILAWIHSNARINDNTARMDKRIDDLREIIRAEAASTRTELRAELRRVEEVVDARLKHLEERYD